MRLKTLVVIIYLLLCFVSFLMSASEGYWGGGSSLSLLLTLPWSVTMIFFAWALIHDGARSLMVFLVPFALLNSFLLHTIIARLTKARSNPDKGAAQQS